MKKWIIISTIIVVIGGVSAWFFLHKTDKTQGVMAASQTTTVQKGKLEVAVSGSGSVTANTDQDVTAKDTILIVDSISVAAGDTVKKGDTLVTFKNGAVVAAPYDGEIKSVSAKKGGKASQGTVLLRMEDANGYTSPVTRGNNSVSSDKASGGSGLTADSVSVKEGDVVDAGATLVTFTDGSILQAPVTGTITSLSVASGDSVQVSDPVAHITNYNALQTTISVDELDVPKVKEGQAVKITASAFGDETFSGKVTNVATKGTSEKGVSTFDVTVQIEDPKNMKIGMSTEASISIESKEDALYVPVEAVYTNGNEKYVLIPTSSDDSTQSTKKVKVETGISNDTYVEITKGLAKGDTVQIPRVQSKGKSSQGPMMMPGGNSQGGFGGNFQGRPGGEFGGKSSGRAPSGGGQGGH
ncbi:efflux RND transporter periplasmic adaptor subunit [Bacillus paramycoides]|uniref:efflux RND transporter periplasmic adaptor subunit n=1 Tax=Bacillus paramycoides TaxID=2026194 RepID=UPI003D049E7E